MKFNFKCFESLMLSIHFSDIRYSSLPSHMTIIAIRLSTTYYNPANFFNVSKRFSEQFGEHEQLLVVHFDKWDNDVTYSCKIDRKANSSTAPRIMFKGGVENPYRIWVQRKYKEGDVFNLYLHFDKPNQILLV